MKALTIRQPWAQLVTLGQKTIETRTRATKHRGPLAIHAGLHSPPKCARCNGTGMPGPEGDACDWCSGDGIDTVGEVTSEELVYGAIVAVAELVDCVPMVEDGWPANEVWRPALVIENDTLTLYRSSDPDDSESVDDQRPFGHFAADRWAWILRGIRPVDPPVPARGAQGLWNVPADVEAAVRAQLREVVAS